MMKVQVLCAMAICLTVACTANKEQSHKHIAPLDSGIRLEALTDCTLPVQFKYDDFNWRGNSLSVTVMNEDLYDAAEISQMQIGDTLVYEGSPMVITSITPGNSGITINNGLEEGGAELMPAEGGTYRATIWNDHSVYSTLGKAQLMLADDFIIIDCGEDFKSPSDTIRTNQKAYFDNLSETSRDYFFELNTRVVIENGKVTEINRHWIP
ncbi:MAG: hypothetical protein Q4B58_01515 [Bacteroidales bacterium]|nr:hypothetical protein [Bacteroidales bacterium]